MSKLIVPLLLILGGIAVVMLLIVPTWQQYLVLRADTSHLGDVNGEIDALTQKRDELVNQIAHIPKDDLQRLDQVMPSAPQGPEFLLSIQKLAVFHGLTVTKLDLAGSLGTKQKTPQASETKASEFTPVGQTSGQTGQEAKKITYQTLLVNLEVAGQYESFKKFLRDVESSIRIIDIENLDLTPKEKEFNFKLGLKTYYQ